MKRQKMELSDLKYLLFSGIGGTPPPLTENHLAHKPLTERGGTPEYFFYFLCTLEYARQLPVLLVCQRDNDKVYDINLV